MRAPQSRRHWLRYAAAGPCLKSRPWKCGRSARAARPRPWTTPSVAHRRVLLPHAHRLPPRGGIDGKTKPGFPEVMGADSCLRADAYRRTVVRGQGRSAEPPGRARSRSGRSYRFRRGDLVLVIRGLSWRSSSLSCASSLSAQPAKASGGMPLATIPTTPEGVVNCTTSLLPRRRVFMVMWLEVESSLHERAHLALAPQRRPSAAASSAGAGCADCMIAAPSTALAIRASS